MKQTEEQRYNLLQQYNVVQASGCYCPNTYKNNIPKGYKECPCCVGKGWDDNYDDEWVDCYYCDGKGYVKEKEYNKYFEEE